MHGSLSIVQNTILPLDNITESKCHWMDVFSLKQELTLHTPSEGLL